MTGPGLDAEGLLAAACERTGLSEFGDRGFVEPLRVLLRSLEADAALSAVGRSVAPSMLLDLLANRLALVDTRKRHPEIGDEPIHRPLFILGLGRTGTTALHALLAADPAHRTPLSWEVAFPCPPPERASFDSDPRIAQSEARLAALHRIRPEFQAIHPQGAREPQECVAITAHEFLSVQFISTFRATSYWDWLEAQPAARWRPVYEFHRRFLQHLQWKCPGERWVLKSPGHLYSLDALLDAYPDAAIVWTHRHPAAVMASVASLRATLRSVYSDEIHPEEIGAESLDRYARALDRALGVRASRPGDAHRFVDVHYRDFIADPLACVRGLYQRLGLALTPEALARMQQHAAANPKDRHGAHAYTLARYGLDAERVFQRCREYCERFGFERFAREGSASAES